MKRWIPYLLMGYFVIQLVVPGYVVYRHYDTLNTGVDYKFEVMPYDPYDPFRGRYVALDTVASTRYHEGEYAVLGTDSNGFATITQWALEKPEGEEYVKNLEISRYYMNEKMAPEAERLQRSLDVETDKMYVIIKVKNGHYVIQGLYLNDVPIEQYLGTKTS